MPAVYIYELRDAADPEQTNIYVGHTLIKEASQVVLSHYKAVDAGATQPVYEWMRSKETEVIPTPCIATLTDGVVIGQQHTFSSHAQALDAIKSIKDDYRAQGKNVF